jgi:hypothetical protein
MTDFVWLKHKEHGGYFNSPANAVDDMAELGWEPSDPPPPQVEATVAEQVAWRAEQEAAAAQAEKKSKSTKAAARGKNEE